MCVPPIRIEEDPYLDYCVSIWGIAFAFTTYYPFLPSLERISQILFPTPILHSLKTFPILNPLPLGLPTPWQPHQSNPMTTLNTMIHQQPTSNPHITHTKHNLLPRKPLTLHPFKKNTRFVPRGAQRPSEHENEPYASMKNHKFREFFEMLGDETPSLRYDPFTLLIVQSLVKKVTCYSTFFSPTLHTHHHTQDLEWKFSLYSNARRCYHPSWHSSPTIWSSSSNQRQKVELMLASDGTLVCSKT